MRKAAYLQALFAAVPRVFNVFIVLFILVIIFGIVGVQVRSNHNSRLCHRTTCACFPRFQSFSGAMDICTDPSAETISDCTGSFYLTGESCAFLPTDAAESSCKTNQTGTLFPRLWTTYQNPDVSPESFDNIGRSMLVVFELMIGGSWPVSWSHVTTIHIYHLHFDVSIFVGDNVFRREWR